LMRAVIALHAPLGLRRTRGHQPNAQLRAHASELRDRSLAPQPFALAGRALVQILPVHVERLRHAVALDPAAQRVGRCPDRLLLAEPPERSTGGVVHSPSASIQRRNVSAAMCSPSSLARCSAASVGPKRCPTSPLYFSRTRRSTCWRNAPGLARALARPTLRCFSPAAPAQRYRRHSRFACR